MSRKEFLIARLGLVRRDLLEAVNNAESVSTNWAPQKSMRAAGGLIQEIVATEQHTIQFLTEGKPGSYGPLYESNLRESWEDYLQLLKETRDCTVAWLDTWNERSLAEELRLPKNWDEMGFASLPRAEVVLNIAMHESYHTGQLVSYLWASGTDPYHW